MRAHRKTSRVNGVVMKSGTATKKVIVEFPAGLLERAEKAASELSTDRSKLIRTAVEQFLSESEKQKRDQELAEGYAANAALDRRICEEFAAVDTENI